MRKEKNLYQLPEMEVVRFSDKPMCTDIIVTSSEIKADDYENIFGGN